MCNVVGTQPAPAHKKAFKIRPQHVTYRQLLEWSQHACQAPLKSNHLRAIKAISRELKAPGEWKAPGEQIPLTSNQCFRKVWKETDSFELGWGGKSQAKVKFTRLHLQACSATAPLPSPKPPPLPQTLPSQHGQVTSYMRKQIYRLSENSTD